jgi:hypothetical protein
MTDKPEPMTAAHAYLIVAATIAAASKHGRPAHEVYNEYVRVLNRVQLDDINPSPVDDTDL